MTSLASFFSIQHIVLKRMKRPASSDRALEQIEHWREICPNIVIRSTFIVGFPGESDDDFEQLLTFLRSARLDRVGCFQYENVDGAPANHLPDHVPDEVKQDRFDRFMTKQQQISAKRLQSKIGQSIDVIIDDVDDEGAIGRSKGDAPEIDGAVYLNGDTELAPGDIVTATVKHADEYDVWAIRED